MPFKILDGEHAVPGSTIQVDSAVHASYDADDFESAELTLQDSSGTVLATGSLDEHTLDDAFAPGGASGVLVKLSGQLDVPTSIPVSEAGELAYLVWTIEFDGEDDVHAVEPITLYEAGDVEYGLFNSVGLGGFDVHGVLAGIGDDVVRVEVFTPPPEDERLGIVVPERSSNIERTVAKGRFTPDKAWVIVNGTAEKTVYNPTFDEDEGTYTTETDNEAQGYDSERSYQLEPEVSLDPYTLQWYTQDAHEALAHVGTSLSWVVNNIITQAMHELVLEMERDISAPGLVQTAFSNAELVQFLQMGRDLFNMLEKPSTFTMIKAAGQIRYGWLVCAQYRAATSRQLQEAVKAFDFAGQSTSLNIDLSPAYEAFRGGLESLIESTIKPYKRQLALRNILSGDGSEDAMKGRPSIAQGWTDSTILNRGGLRSRWLSGGLH